MVVVDPINNLMSAGSHADAEAMLIRLVDYLKSEQVTGFFTSLSGEKNLERTEVSISSLMDTWILLRDIEIQGERNRGIYILKARGLAHSNQIREFLLTDHGINLVDVYQGSEGVLTGSARVNQEAREKASEALKQYEIERKRADFERKKAAVDAQIKVLLAELSGEEAEIEKIIKNEKFRLEAMAHGRKTMSKMRKAD